MRGDRDVFLLLLEYLSLHDFAMLVTCPHCGQRLDVRLSEADEFRLRELERQPWHAGQIEEAARRMEMGESGGGAALLKRVLEQWEAAGVGVGIFGPWETSDGEV